MPDKIPADAVAIAASIKTHIAALNSDPNLSPLMSFALSNLRGAQNALEGHLVKVAADAEAVAKKAEAAAAAAQ